MPIRSCVGCRQRWPISQLLGLTWRDDTCHVVRLAGTPVRRPGPEPEPGRRETKGTGEEAGTARPHAGRATEPIDETRLVNGAEVAEGAPQSGRPQGKGWSACPDAKCLERALRAKGAEARSRAAKQAAAGREPAGLDNTGGGREAGAGKKRGDGRKVRAVGQPGVGDAVARVLDEATLLVAQWIEARQDGLRRRRVPVTGDARLDAWQQLADRMNAARTGR